MLDEAEPGKVIPAMYRVALVHCSILTVSLAMERHGKGRYGVVRPGVQMCGPARYGWVR